MKPLSIRLMTAVNLLPQCHLMADIGADHGYVLEYVLTHGLAEIGFAVENKKGPYEKCVSTLSSYDNAICSLSDGIEKIPQDTDCVIILGMGGETIASILKAHPERLEKTEYLLISAHGNEDQVHDVLSSMNYGIVRADACYDAGKYYEIFLYQKEIPVLPMKELLKKAKNPSYEQHLSEEISIREKLLEKDLPEARRTALQKEITELETLR